MMKDSAIGVSDTLAGKEYAGFLNSHGFRLVLDENGDDFSCTVFLRGDILIAFTYQRGFGENLAVAEAGSPIDPASIAVRKDGWSLIGEVWKEAYQDYHKIRKQSPYPHQLNKEQEIKLVTEILSTFMEKVSNNEISISDPGYRMNT